MHLLNSMTKLTQRLMMIAFTGLICLPATSQATIETYEFATQQQTEDYLHLIKELRCLVCQNQNLAESNAPLAQDLRKQTAHLLGDQQLNREQVIDFMVQRYGDFVLYRPPVQANTSLLWLGPLLLLGLGFFWGIRLIQQASKNAKNNP